MVRSPVAHLDRAIVQGRQVRAAQAEVQFRWTATEVNRLWRTNARTQVRIFSQFHANLLHHIARGIISLKYIERSSAFEGGPKLIEINGPLFVRRDADVDITV